MSVSRQGLHVHEFKTAELVVPIYASVVYKSGKVRRSHMNGKDTLKQLICRDQKCGAVVTVDLDRFKA